MDWNKTQDGFFSGSRYPFILFALLVLATLLVASMMARAQTPVHTTPTALASQSAKIGKRFVDDVLDAATKGIRDEQLNNKCQWLTENLRQGKISFVGLGLTGNQRLVLDNYCTGPMPSAGDVIAQADSAPRN